MWVTHTMTRQLEFLTCPKRQWDSPLGATVRIRTQACEDEKSLIGHELSLERTPGAVPRWDLSLLRACALARDL